MLGYCFSRRAWGKGFATEAGSAMLKFAFEGVGLASVWAGCDVRNQGSVRVLEKLGMSLMSRHTHEPEGDDEGGESFMFRISNEEWTRAAGAPT